MKRALSVIMLIILLFLTVSCNESDGPAYSGVNAEILEISKELHGFVVRGLDEDSILGEKCFLNCEVEGVYFIYVDNETSEFIDLKYDDFKVGDEIAVEINSVENKHALTYMVQLLTQRM